MTESLTAPTIRQLDTTTSLKIAAGEVVERPASVVKELLENALDAGARRIAVTLRGGGLDTIRVVDDGIGITAGDARLLFSRHATSKIRDIDDLQRLTTFGFRGEALASIASVAEVTVLSRPRSADHGTTATVAGGRLVEAGPAGCPFGTSVTVRHLFFNVPARLKFVRSAPSETGQIAQTVGLYAVAHPDVHLTFTADGRTPIVYTGEGDRRAVAVIVLGDAIGSAMLDLAGTPSDPVRVHGLVTSPDAHRPTRSGLHFYVNRRPVYSRTLQIAVADAYHLLLPEGRHPCGLIFIEIDPADVDVNVHPRKWEVRFVREREIFAAVQRAVRRTLAELATPPSISTGLQPIGGPGASGVAGRGSATPTMATNPSSVTPPAGLVSLPAAGFDTRDQDVPGQAALFAFQSQLAGPQLANGDHPGPGTEDTAQAAGGDRLPILRILGQVQNTYIVCEGPDGVYFIDQHTAHERVIYEEILAQRAVVGVARQTLLEPTVVDLTGRQSGLLAEHAAAVEALGFSVEPFGAGVALVRALPAPLARAQPGTVLLSLIEALADRSAPADGSDRGVATIACHSAVRAGDALTAAEIRELIQRLERTDLGRICPHGRPTVIRLPAAQLERDFHRR